MIFKQRLFTILLGLLFATVLTDQASALYDPGVGRFCSRDPIGHTGSPKQLYGFLSDNPVAAVDPTGNITVKHQHVWGSCKTGGNASFYISADGNPNRPLETPSAPCDGYLIQQLTATCSKRNCPCKEGPDPTNNRETWLSAKAYNKGDLISKIVADFSAQADIACAYYGYTIEFKYVCSEDLQQPLENTPGWGRITRGDPRVENACFKPSGELVLKLRDGIATPEINAPSAPGEKSGSAKVEFNFCCCNKPSDYYLVGYTASDDEFGGIDAL